VIRGVQERNKRLRVCLSTAGIGRSDDESERPEVVGVEGRQTARRNRRVPIASNGATRRPFGYDNASIRRRIVAYRSGEQYQPASSIASVALVGAYRIVPETAQDDEDRPRSRYALGIGDGATVGVVDDGRAIVSFCEREPRSIGVAEGTVVAEPFQGVRLFDGFDAYRSVLDDALDAPGVRIPLVDTVGDNFVVDRFRCSDASVQFPEGV
jgi:hypothetical protein